MNDFCPLINDKCNPNCVLIEKGQGVFGLANYCSFASAIKKSDTTVIAELKKLANKHR